MCESNVTMGKRGVPKGSVGNGVVCRKTAQHFVVFCYLLGPQAYAEVAPHPGAVSLRQYGGEFVYIPSGRFVMGSREGQADARPGEARVTGFWMGAAELTAGAYARFLNDTGYPVSTATNVLKLQGQRWEPRARYAPMPITYVSYRDALAYCRWLSRREGVVARLPTEAEWEYAARGGIRKARYPWGWGTPRGRACFDADTVYPVRSFEPNPFGLYDMAGNVYEWCRAGGRTGAREEAPARGGSWAEKDPKLLRVFHRVWFPLDYRDADVGFRIVVEKTNRD